jgi:hypothetical protein
MKIVYFPLPMTKTYKEMLYKNKIQLHKKTQQENNKKLLQTTEKNSKIVDSINSTTYKLLNK